MSVEPSKISRQKALSELGYSATDRVRNYELEHDLSSKLGGEWVVAEWCPFNGLFCQWISYAPDEDLDKTIKWWEDNRAANAEHGLNVDYHIQYLQTRGQVPK